MTNARALVVDDDPSVRAGQGYELVCLDIMLPELDGIEVLQELRRLEQICQPQGIEVRAKVVMTTALSDYQHFHSAFAQECDSYLVKPITRVALDRQLARLGVAPRG